MSTTLRRVSSLFFFTTLACGSAPPSQAPVAPDLKLTDRSTPPAARAAERAVSPSAAAPSAVLPAAVAAQPVQARLSPGLLARRRLSVSDGGTCWLSPRGVLQCFGSSNVRTASGTFSAMLGFEALTSDGRLVNPWSMQEVAPIWRLPNGEHSYPKAAHVVRSTQGDGCLIRSDDSTLFCFGQSWYRRVPGGAFVDLVAVPRDDGTAYCGLGADGKLVCFSEREEATQFSQFTVPQGKFTDLGEWCALRESGELACFDDRIAAWASKVPKLQRIYASSAWSICGLDKDGTAGCWGPHGEKAPVSTPYDFVGFAVSRACGLLKDKVECWGRSNGGVLNPPPEIGRYVAGRPYLIGKSGLAFDATVTSLGISKPPGNCRELADEAAPARIQLLARHLREQVPINALGKLSLTRANSASPLLLACGDEYMFRWFFVDSHDAKDRSDLTLVVPSSASLQKFKRRYEAASRTHARGPDASTDGNFKHAAKFRGHPAIMEWTGRRATGDDSKQWTGHATLTAELDGYLAIEVTTSASMRLETDFNVFFETLLFNVPKIAEELQQTASNSAGPIDSTLGAMSGAYPRDLLAKHPEIEKRLKETLGGQRSAFEQRFSVESRLQVIGDYLVAAGCQQRVCLFEAAVFVVNLRTKELHAGIVSGPAPSGSKTIGVKRGEQAPEVLTQWLSDRRAAIRESSGSSSGRMGQCARAGG